MKKHLFAVFAHPDDESFGPAGALLSAAKSGVKLHLITLTAGQAGENPDHREDLASLRLSEWQKAGELLGATTMTHYGYTDGSLDQDALVDTITRLSRQIEDVLDKGDTYELMAFEFDGITGHIDHIVATRAAANVYEQSLDGEHPAERLRLFCLSEDQVPEFDDNTGIYSATGYPKDLIDETIDACRYHDEIRSIVACHQSQKSDLTTHLARPDSNLCVNHFVIL